MALREDVERESRREVLGADPPRLFTFGESVSLARRRQRFRMQRRHQKLRALGVRVIWAAVVLVTVLVVIGQWLLLRLS